MTQAAHATGPKPHAAKTLLELWMYAAGTSEVPKLYHTWACLAAMAACVADRVWIRKFAWQPIRPNLYVLLVGPSGGGKGVGVKFAQRLLGRLPGVAIHAGMTTAQGLLKYMASGESEAGADRRRVLLLTEETSMCIGEGPIAKDFVKHMTGLYQGDADGLAKSTAKDGTVVLDSYNVVWLGGTTREWMMESIPRSAIEGGALARICAIHVPHYGSDRYPMPVMPMDYDLVERMLLERLQRLTMLAGEVVVSDEARELHDRWYMERPEPMDEALWPTWRREDDLIWKLTMLLALSEAPTMRAEARHFLAGQKMARVALSSVPGLVRFASQSAIGQKLAIIAAVIERAGRVQHSVLQRAAGARGIIGREYAEIIKQLLEEKRIEAQPGQVYVWTGRTKVVVEEVPPTEHEEGDDD